MPDRLAVGPSAWRPRTKGRRPGRKAVAMMQSPGAGPHLPHLL
jgi:hypothetical protein